MLDKLIERFDGKFAELMNRLDEIEKKIDEIREK